MGNKDAKRREVKKPKQKKVKPSATQMTFPEKKVPGKP